MTSDLSHLNSVFPLLLESIFISSSLAVILIDWNHSFLETSLLRLIQSYLPRWRNRNIRQDVYLCLVMAALAIIYHSSMKQLSINQEICRVTAVTIIILLSFWSKSKTKIERSSEPQSEVNVEEELRMSYVDAFRTQFNEEEVTQEELITAIQYLNLLKGGIAAHRSAEKLIDAVDHIQRMGQRSRLDDTYEELHQIMVEKRGYPLEDFERVVEECLENNSFLPSPEEFVEIHHDMKGIVQLEKEVAQTKREMEETQRVVEETTQEVVESRQEIQSLRKRLQNKIRINALNLKNLKEMNQALQQNQQALQQNQQALQQKERIIHQERHRVRMLEESSQQLSEGVWQRRLRELEGEIRRLSAQSNRSKCKICLVKDVQVFFTPCNHLISCQRCVKSLPNQICPMCRKPIQRTVPVLLA